MSDFIPTGSLEQMGISVETNLPDGALTPAYAKGVKFTQTKPGYHFREVEAYKESVDYTLEVYAALLHQRDLDVHRLGGELDRSQVDIKNLQNQIEVYEFKGGIAQADATDDEVSSLLETNEQLRARIQQLEADNVAAAAQVAELNAWADSVTEYVATLEAQVANNNGTPATAAEQAIVDAYEPEPAYVEPAYQESQYVETQPQQQPAQNQQFGGPALPPGITMEDLN